MADALAIRSATGDDAAVLAGIGGRAWNLIWAFRDNPGARQFYERMGLAIDAETDWVLGGVPCPIVRFRLDWPADPPA